MQISGMGLLLLCLGLESVIFRSGWARHMARPFLGFSIGSVRFWKYAGLIWGTVLAIYGFVVLIGIYDLKAHFDRPINFATRDLSLIFSVFIIGLGIYSAVLFRSYIRAAVEEHDGILGLIPSKLTYTWIGLLLLAICFVVGGLGLAGLIELVL